MDFLYFEKNILLQRNIQVLFEVLCLLIGAHIELLDANGSILIFEVCQRLSIKWNPCLFKFESLHCETKKVGTVTFILN